MKRFVFLIVVPIAVYLWALSEASVRDLSRTEITLIYVIVIFFAVLVVSHLLYLVGKIFGDSDKKTIKYSENRI